MSAQSMSKLVSLAKTFPQQWNNYMTRFAKVLSGGVVNFQKMTISYSDLVDGTSVAFGDALPAGAVITKATIHVTSGFTSDGDGSSTISLGAATATDLKAATAVSDALWANTGYKAGVPVDTVATQVPLSAAGQMTAKLTIAATDTKLTGGQFDLWIEWVDGND